MRGPMKTIPVLLVGIAMLLAGCANTTNDHTTTTPTGTTTTPSATPAATPTPATPTGMTPAAPDCPAPTAGTAAPALTNVTELVYTVTEPSGNSKCYAFHGPSTGPSGWVKVTLSNTGHEPHQVAIVNLGNMTIAAFAQSLHSPPGTMDMHTAGGPTPYGGPQAGPGENSTVLVNLTAGNYAVVCYIPGMNGMPHAMQGMVASLTIGPVKTNLTEPTSDLALNLTDYAFSWSPNATAGNHTIRIVNNGMHHHEAALVGLVGNATAKDFIAAFEPNATAPPPIAHLMGIAPMDASQHAYAYVDLTPGHWALLCFEQDSPQDPPHFVKGMVLDFTVA